MLRYHYHFYSFDKLEKLHDIDSIKTLILPFDLASFGRRDFDNAQKTNH